MWDRPVTGNESEMKTKPRELGTADIARIMKLLPHRYPFLLVDKIVEMDGDNSAVGIKNVTINEPFFQGHFPNFPVMPGVLLIEGMAQTAGALCVATMAANYEPQLVYFMSIDRARFRRPVAARGYRPLSHVQAAQPRAGLAFRWKSHGEWPARGRSRDQRHDCGPNQAGRSDRG